MNVLFASDPVVASTDLDVKTLLADAVRNALSSNNENDTNLISLLEDLLEHLNKKVARFPELTQVHHSNLPCQALVIQWNDSVGDKEEDHSKRETAADAPQQRHINVVLQILMPCQESALLWMPPHPTQQGLFEDCDPASYFHAIQIAGRPAVQARATRCYDHAYAYSGQTHPIQAETPLDIRQLYRHINAVFGLPQDGRGGVNMCLENDYRNGHHSISEHSDDEKAFGNLHDVYCFLTGPASREAVLSVRKAASKVATKDQLLKLQPTPQQREVLRIKLPAGLYVMQGRAFQGRYTHAFPKLSEHLFRRIVNAEPSLPKRQRGRILPGFPVEDEDGKRSSGKTLLHQAAWVQDHADVVRRKILEGCFATTKRHKVQTTPAQDAAAFDEWCLWRTSYTLRNFRVDPSSPNDGNKKRRKT